MRSITNINSTFFLHLRSVRKLIYILYLPYTTKKTNIKQEIGEQIETEQYWLLRKTPKKEFTVEGKAKVVVVVVVHVLLVLLLFKGKSKSHELLTKQN